METLRDHPGIVEIYIMQPRAETPFDPTYVVPTLRDLEETDAPRLPLPLPLDTPGPDPETDW